MKTTKKAFREYLNKKYGFTSTQKWNAQSGAKTRAYGDWLYSADKGMFDHIYQVWLKTGSEEE